MCGCILMSKVPDSAVIYIGPWKNVNVDEFAVLIQQYLTLPTAEAIERAVSC